jgi:hypothetical protein
MQLNADLSNVEIQEGFDLLAPGWYVGEVFDSEIINSKTSGKPYIKWTWQIVGKPNRVWNNMSIDHKISKEMLKTMAHCCGHRNPNYIADTEELHGKRCQIRIKITKSEGYDDKNEISNYKPLETSSVSSLPKETPPAFVVAAATESKPTTPTMPWQK